LRRSVIDRRTGGAPVAHRMRSRCLPSARRRHTTRCARAYKKRHLRSVRHRKKICASAAVCYVARRFVQLLILSHRSRLTFAYTSGDSPMAKKGGAPTKSEILAQISKDSELSRKQVSEVFESLNGIIKKSLRGNGLFTLPGLLKLKVVKRPATKAREGINPFTGEKMTFKAKPASKKVRALPLKNLKSMVN
jgi:nucleoid DNA-binding protein